MKVSLKQVSINDVVALLNRGMEAYKFSQELFIKIDGKIHNEFVYSSRALTSLIESKEQCGNYDQPTLNDAYQSAKHILNDSLDLVVSYAAFKIKYLNGICKYSTVSHSYKDYEKIVLILKKYQLKIAETRKTRGQQRIDDYIEMLDSDDYKLLYDFCLSIDSIEDSLKRKRKEELANTGKWILGIIIAIIGICFTAIKIFSH